MGKVCLQVSSDRSLRLPLVGQMVDLAGGAGGWGQEEDLQEEEEGRYPHKEHKKNLTVYTRLGRLGYEGCGSGVTTVLRKPIVTKIHLSIQ